MCCCVQVERSAQLKAQLVQHEEKAQWMNNHVEDIKMQLRQTQQGSPFICMCISHNLV